MRMAGPVFPPCCLSPDRAVAVVHSVRDVAIQLESVVRSVVAVDTTDQVLSVRVRVMKRALPSLVSPKPDSTMATTSFTTGSFSFMPREVAKTRDSKPKSFMVVPKTEV